jgi:GR25 family glycosyltransferase involved in LPS biosynthesis
MNFVVSFTTIPSRLKFVPGIIDKIKKQTFQPTIIFVSIPYFSIRKNIEYIIPNNWNFEDNIIIVRCDDYGPGTKLLGCIPYISDPETMIITIDDDISYGDNTFEILVKYGVKYPNSAISFKGLTKNITGSICKNKDIQELYGIQGYGGVLYRRKFISNDMIKYFEDLFIDYSCFVSDDLTISKWLRLQNINMIQICDYDNNVRVFSEIDTFDALHRENRNNYYENCEKNLTLLDDKSDPYFPNISIYVMNMPDRIDRKIHMKNMLKKIGVNPNNIVFNSENQHMIPFRSKEDVKDRQKLIKQNKLTLEGSNKLNDPYVANALGHLDYIKVIADSKKIGIIMEDDIIQLTHYQKIGLLLEKAIEELPEDADMLFLEMCHEQCDKIKKISKNLYKLYRPSCSAAILYTPRGAKKILKLCLPIFDGIDIMFPILIEKQEIIAYGIDGMLFAQDEYYGTDADRNNEKFRKIHKVRVPLCNTGKMTEIQNSIIPIPINSTSNNKIILIIIVIIIISFTLISFLIYRNTKRK